MKQKGEAEDEGLFSETALGPSGAILLELCGWRSAGEKRDQRARRAEGLAGIGGESIEARPDQKMKVGGSHRGMGSPAQIAEAEKAFDGESEADQKPLD